MGLEVAKGIVRLEAGITPAERLDFRPRALVLWWCREQSAGCAGGIGFATDGAGQASAAWVADDGMAPGVLSRWGAEAPLLFHEDPRAPDASYRAQIRLDGHGFSVDCDREPEYRWLVHYLALGGSDLRSAAVCDLVLDRTGRTAVSGLGFQPSTALTLLGAGSAVGVPRSGLAVGFGVAARPSEQAASGFVAQADAGGTIARGAQCTDAVAVLPACEPSGEMDVVSRLVSFDRDGFTLETTRLTSGLPIAVLALAGGDYAVGMGSASSKTTAIGFRPAGALLFGTGLTATARPRDIGRLCLGGFSRDRSVGCVSWSTLRRGAWPPEPRSRSTTDAPFEVMDTTSGGLHAGSRLSTVGRRRFSLTWPIRDRFPRQFGYVAFGPERHRSRLRDRLRLLSRGGSQRE